MEKVSYPYLQIYNFFALFARYLDSWCKSRHYLNTVYFFCKIFLER